MQENLVIVESPAKAKTIEKFLGDDFKVMSSYGHIRDLKKKELSIDKETLQPAYVIPKDKEELVKRLRESAKKADKVWLASDEDREGEAISWHLCEVLGLDEASTNRIVFHEITKPAILAAIENPRHLDMNLVNAQQARRVLQALARAVAQGEAGAFCRTRAVGSRATHRRARTRDTAVQERALLPHQRHLRHH